jgi:hypothetical protein
VPVIAQSLAQKTTAAAATVFWVAVIVILLAKESRTNHLNGFWLGSEGPF